MLALHHYMPNTSSTLDEQTSNMASKYVSKETTPSLLVLPGEPRLIIYDHVLADEEPITMDIGSDVLVFTDINPTALASRGVCKAISAEATEYFYGKAKVRIRINREQKLINTEANANWAFLAVVQTLQIDTKVQVNESTQDILTNLEDALLILNASATLKNFCLRLYVETGPEFTKQEQGKMYMKLTHCRMAVLKEGQAKGNSAAKTEVEFGLKAVKILRKLKES